MATFLLDTNIIVDAINDKRDRRQPGGSLRPHEAEEINALRSWHAQTRALQKRHYVEHGGRPDCSRGHSQPANAPNFSMAHYN